MGGRAGGWAVGNGQGAIGNRQAAETGHALSVLIIRKIRNKYGKFITILFFRGFTKFY
jgi:hypothetical protein